MHSLHNQVNEHLCMGEISDLTYKIVAYSAFPDYDQDEFVDWALEMVFSGYESPHLLMLAGFVKPANYFQSTDYVRKALSELGLTPKTGLEAVMSYSSYYIKKIARSEQVEENLYVVYKLSQSTQYDKIIYDFALLYWAWEDLNCEDELQNYWSGANRSNIHSIITETARNWLEENKEKIQLVVQQL